MHCKRFILLLIIMLLILPLARGQDISLTLPEAIYIALRENPQVLLKENELEKAKKKIAEAKSALLPSLNLSFSISETQGYYSKDTQQQNASLGLKQTLYSGGKIINTIRLNEDNFEITQAILDKTKIELIFNTAKAFYSLLLAEELAQLNNEILKNTTSHLEAINVRYQNGQASSLEVENIKKNQKKAEENYENSLNQIQELKSLIKNLLHLNEEVNISASGEFTYAPEEIAFDEAFVTALGKRPEIKQYEAEISRAKKSAEIVRAGNRPTVYASWDYYSRSHSTSIIGPSKNPNDYNVVGLSLSWPIFDGWQTKLRLDEAMLDIKQAQIAKDMVKRDIGLELKNAYLALKDALSKIKTAEAETSFYANNYQTVKEKYSQGIASNLDLSDAQIQNQTASFNKKKAIYEYIVAKLAFEKATGGLYENS